MISCSICNKDKRVIICQACNFRSCYSCNIKLECISCHNPFDSEFVAINFGKSYLFDTDKIATIQQYVDAIYKKYEGKVSKIREIVSQYKNFLYLLYKLNSNFQQNCMAPGCDGIIDNFNKSFSGKCRRCIKCKNFTCIGCNTIYIQRRHQCSGHIDIHHRQLTSDLRTFFQRR